MPFGVGPWELAILVGLLVLLFGAKGVPDVAKRLGTSVRELKGAMDDVDPRRMLEPGDDAARPAAAPKPKPKPED
jgi:sec-independent protein translocase protein TatA